MFQNCGQGLGEIYLMRAFVLFVHGAGVIRRRSVFFLAALLCLPIVARAGAEEKLPTGREVFENSIKATGGAEAFTKLENRRVVARMEIGKAKTAGTVTIYSARPNKIYSRIEIEGIGVVEQGVVGDVVWVRQPNSKPQIIEGDEKKMELFLSQFQMTDFDALYESAECVGIEKVSGLDCYKVIFTPKGGITPITSYYSLEQGLPLKMEYDMPHPAGPINIMTFSSQFEKIDGVLLPRNNLEYALGEKTTFIVTEIGHQVELPEGCFDLPQDVQALLEAKN